jgi:hypothetical protein
MNRGVLRQHLGLRRQSVASTALLSAGGAWKFQTGAVRTKAVSRSACHRISPKCFAGAHQNSGRFSANPLPLVPRGERKRLQLAPITGKRVSVVTMMFRILFLLLANSGFLPAQSSYQDINEPPHNYRQRTPQDRFTQLKDRFESGQIPLDRSSEKAFVLSVLQALDIPASSQMLVFSTTSLQLSLISPSNPRALYFNEDIYLGYVPGGRIEIVSLDPELGGIFYIFDIPKDARPLRIERSERCMNCHSGEETGYVPGLVIKSVVPGPTGGSLTEYRMELTGHGVPFEQRFGGWHVTGKHGITNHWGNLTGRLTAGDLLKISNPPGARFNFNKYPVAGSDILPQLLHEHQAGFVNRVVEASYRARTALHAGRGQITPEAGVELDEQARIITRYLLFADEAPLPPGGVEGDADYKTEFLRTRRATAEGVSLKDFDLRTRLFKHRCSYMIYSPVFSGLPSAMKQRVYERLGEALRGGKPKADYSYLAATERKALRDILKATLTDLPDGW